MNARDCSGTSHYKTTCEGDGFGRARCCLFQGTIVTIVTIIVTLFTLPIMFTEEISYFARGIRNGSQIDAM